MNRYNYAKSSPSNYIDLSGHRSSYYVDTDKIIRDVYEYYRQQADKWINDRRDEFHEWLFGGSETIIEETTVFLDAVIDIEAKSGYGISVIATSETAKIEAGFKHYREVTLEGSGIDREKMGLEIVLPSGAGIEIFKELDIETGKYTDWKLNPSQQIENASIEEENGDLIINFGGGVYTLQGGGEIEIKINVSELDRQIQNAFNRLHSGYCD